MNKEQAIPVRNAKCPTCPFREGSSLAFLADDLGDCAKKQASRICHSTGNSVIHGKTGNPELICRGARDVQLQHFYGLGFIAEPTDKAWNDKLQEVLNRKATTARKERIYA